MENLLRRHSIAAKGLNRSYYLKEAFLPKRKAHSDVVFCQSSVKLLSKQNCLSVWQWYLKNLTKFLKI